MYKSPTHFAAPPRPLPSAPEPGRRPRLATNSPSQFPMLHAEYCGDCPTGIGWDCQMCDQLDGNSPIAPHVPNTPSLPAPQPAPPPDPARGLNETIFVIHCHPDPLRGRVSLLSSGSLELLGYIPGEFSADTDLWANILHPDDRAQVESVTRDAIQSGEPRHRTYRLRHAASNRYHQVSDTITPVLGADGQVAAAIGIARVIDGETLPLPAATQPPFDLQRILEALPDPAMLIDHSRRILQTNAALSRFLGAAPDEWIGRPLESALPVSTSTPPLAGAAGDPLRLARGSDGQQIPVAVRVAPINASEEPVYLTTIRDRTPLLDLQRQFAFQSAIVQSAEDAIIGVDPNLVITYWNNGAERLSGFRAPEAVGSHILMIFPPSCFANFQSELRRVTSGNPSCRRETRILRKDESEVQVSAICSPVYGDGGEIIGTSVILRDITEQKRAENALRLAWSAAESASRAKSAFISNISHELRTPLGHVIGLTELLLDLEHDAIESEHLTTINSSAHTLLDIIDNILLASNLESGRYTLSSQPFGVSELFERALRPFRKLARDKDLELSLNIHHDVPPVLYGDVTSIREIVQNLVDNAIKFTQRGRIDIRVVGSPNDPGAIVIRVIDTGVGVPSAHLQSIFQPFTQVDESLRREFGGAGLGLAICARLAELMNGRIWVDSDGVTGSTFTVSLHLQTPGAAGEEAPEPPPVITDRRVSPRRPATGEVFLRNLRPYSPTPVAGVAVDSSSEGMRIRVPQRFEPGHLVQLEWNGLINVGEIRYCIPSGGDFFVGICRIG